MAAARGQAAAADGDVARGLEGDAEALQERPEPASVLRRVANPALCEHRPLYPGKAAFPTFGDE